MKNDGPIIATSPKAQFSLYKFQLVAKHIFITFQKSFSETKMRHLYLKLLDVYLSSLKELETRKERKKIRTRLRPLQEKLWLSDFIRSKVEQLSSKEIWILVQNHEKRETYGHFFQCLADIAHFEIFFQNYLMLSISKEQIKDLVEDQILSCIECDKEENLKCLIYCLHGSHGKWLIEALLETKLISYIERIDWVSKSLSLMRSAQIKSAEEVIPDRLKQKALERLSPFEAIDFLNLERDQQKRRKMIHALLKKWKKFWTFMPAKESRKALLEIVACSRR